MALKFRDFIFRSSGRLVFIAFLFGGFPSGGAAEESNLSAKLDQVLGKLERLTQVVEEQQERIEKLEVENLQLRSRNDKSSNETPETSTMPTDTPPAAASTGLTSLNPEIGVVADLTGILTESDEDSEGNDKLSVRELEVVFGHDIDPFSRFDSTITFSDFEDPAVEEAYITHWGLPLEMRGRLGRMRPKIGKASATHRDQLETVDEPFVIQEYLGIEGLYRTGLETSYFVPYSTDTFIQDITLGVMEGGIGEEGTLFGDSSRRPSFYSHLKNFWELSRDNNLELGVTYLLGSADPDSSYEVQAFGLDVTYIHYLNSTNRFKLQSEFYFQDRSQAALQSEEHENHSSQESEIGLEERNILFDTSPFGFYVLGDYRLSQRFGLGGRFDYVEPVNLEDGIDNRTLGYTAYFTYYQSEYLRFRAQYQYADLPEGEDNRFFLQATAAIGVHTHQLQ